jgi:16S rRNA (guanine966-N2)-methyltransferase
MGKSAAESSVRIIAGRWKGRRIRFTADGIRPTSDRVRETLFNWLSPHIADARCLDMFAGTGALGLEALSRGAGHVVFIERNRAAFRQLQGNIDQLDSAAASKSATLICGDARAVNLATLTARKGQGPFDIVFLDPPFEAADLQDLCTLLEQSGCLSSDTLIYIEQPRSTDLSVLPDGWRMERERTTGKVRYALARRAMENTQE